MPPDRPLGRLLRGRTVVVVVLIVLLVAGLSWETFGTKTSGLKALIPLRSVEGVYFGDLPGPTQPNIVDPLIDAISPEKNYRLMAIRHIPRVTRGGPMPHPFVGDCKNCHLYRDGPGPGAQQKTPVGAVLEELSHVTKLGPPLHPTSHRPHPPAGRCIKCHDIVVKAPVKRSAGGFLWKL